MKLLDLWDDLQEVRGRSTGRASLYKLAVITWSRPRVWTPGTDFQVPDGWAGQGGIYAMLRSHGHQTDPRRIAYVGKAASFSKRLRRAHQHYDIVERRGKTEVSCGRVRYERIKARDAYYLELEDIVKYAVHSHLENYQGFETLPGFRRTQPRVPAPWLILNEGFRFSGRMPKRIAYPAIGIEF